MNKILDFLKGIFSKKESSLDLMTRIKYFSFGILCFVSYMLVVNMFIQVTTNMFETIFFILAITGIEGTKIYKLVEASTLWHNIKINTTDNFILNIINKIIYRMPALRKYFLYIVFASLAIIGSFGYTLTTVAHTEQVIVQNSDDDIIKGKKDKIAELERDILSDQEQIDALDPTWITARQKIIDRKDAKSAKKDDLIKEINELNKKENNQVKKGTDIFTELGKLVNKSNKEVMLYVLLALSLMVEIGVFSTSPHFMRKEDEPRIERKKPGRKPGFKLNKVLTKVDTFADDVILKENIKEEIINNEAINNNETNIKKEGKEDEIQVDVPKQEEVLKDKEFISIKTPEVSNKEEAHNYVFGRGTEFTKIKFENFVKSLLRDGINNSLIDRYKAAEASKISKNLASTFFDVLSKAKGETGFPLIEFNKNDNTWHSNYSADYIINFMTKIK